MPKEYKITINVSGMPAYVLDELLSGGFYGKTHVEIVERVLLEGLEEKAEGLGLKKRDAEKKGYIPEQ